MENAFIPLSVPNFSGNEKEYVNDAVVSEWVSSGGAKVTEFENKLAEYAGVSSAVACASGTAGLHLAMLVAGIGANDEVIVPSLTFIAAVNPVTYVGAHPVFIGCDDTLCIDPDAVQNFCENNCSMKDGVLVNNKTKRVVKAIEVVHVFGEMCDMERLVDIAEKYSLVLIEDATEALGTYYKEGKYKGCMAGSIGDVGVYSFNGNKIITTGSGGMLVSRHDSWVKHAKHLSTQAKTSEVFYTHDEIGYNYRMTNLQAALGLAQLEQLEGFIARKEEMYAGYVQKLDGKNGLRVLPFKETVRSNKWFFSLYVGDFAMDRDELIDYLQKKRIQTRSIWGLINDQTPYKNNEAYGLEKAVMYHKNIVNLPCSTNLTDSGIQRVCDEILAL